MGTKELCRRTGLNEATLRSWISRGHMTPAKKHGSQEFQWTEDDVRNVSFVLSQTSKGIRAGTSWSLLESRITHDNLLENIEGVLKRASWRSKDLRRTAAKDIGGIFYMMRRCEIETGRHICQPKDVNRKVGASS